MTKARSKGGIKGERSGATMAANLSSGWTMDFIRYENIGV
jgi:hypothetical protein